jgi:simple sugar transport system ATP-binding protein
MEVELHNIYKTFGMVRANIGINLKVPAGSIQSILGENGAGKSTLMKVLSGFIQADSGEILLNHQPVIIQSPADAIRHGIGMLHQDPLDFPPMKVIDDFILGRSGSLFLPRKEAGKEFMALQQKFNFSIDPETYVDTMTVGERQQLEILRLLWLGAQVLILDEPTTGISALQKEKLFETLRLLASQGMTVIFVSHKLEDVENLCDRVAVLRRGELVGEVLSPYDTTQLVELMFGKILTLGERQSCNTEIPAFELKDLEIEDYRMKIEGVNLKLCKGEVIGLAGMEGSGQGILLRACCGLVRPVAGKVMVDGHNLSGKSYHDYMEKGVAFLPASRLEEGLVPGLTLAEHFILAESQQGIFINWKRVYAQTEQRISDFAIHGRPTSKVETLSGGNQQRAILALLRNPLSVLLLEHPTRGLDIESTIYIWDKLKERCRQGASIIFISPDLDEILQYSDHILVFFSGRVSPPLDANNTSVDHLGQLIGGKGWSDTFVA